MRAAAAQRRLRPLLQQGRRSRRPASPSPPKTLSEFDADAVKLTKTSGDAYSQLGFMPQLPRLRVDDHPLRGPVVADVLRPPTASRTSPTTRRSSRDVSSGRRRWSTSSAATTKLDKYRTTFGDEFGDNNPFMTGQVAMAIDGEWRAGMIDDSNSKVDYGVAPFPVPDDQADQYGKGYITGTIVGIASTSQKQNAAWEFVKYLTTDTERGRELRQRDPQRAVDDRGAGLARRSTRTRASRRSSRSPRTRTATRRRPAPTAAPTSSPCRTSATPTSPASRPTCRPGSTRRPRRSTPTSPRPVSGRRRLHVDGRSDGRGDRKRRHAQAAPTERLRNLAFLSPWLLGTGLFFLYPLVTTVYLSFTHYDGFTSAGLDRAGQLALRLPATTRSSGRRCATRCGSSWCMVTLRIVFGLVLGMLVDPRQARAARCSARSSTRRTSPRRWRPPWRSSSCSTPGTGPVNTILGKLGLPEPGLVQRPRLVEARAHPARAVGRRRPDGDLHGRAARRTPRALRGGRARRTAFNIFQPADFGHFEIGNDEIENVLADLGNRFASIRREGDIIPGPLEHDAQHIPHASFIVDN